MVIGLLIVVAGGAIVADRPLVGGVILVSLVPTLAGLDPGLPVPGLRVSQLLIVGVAAIVFLTARSAPWRQFDWIALAYVLCTLGFGLWDLVSRGAAVSSEDLGKLIGPLEFLLLYRVVVVVARSTAVRRTMLKWMMLSSVPVAVFALMQFVNLPGTRALASTYAGETDNLKAYHTFYRATALFGQGHQLGDYLLAIILVGMALFLDPQHSPLKRRCMFAILTVDGLALAATATIAPILAAMLGILGLAYWYGRFGRAMIAVVIVALLGAVIFSSTIAKRETQQFSAEAQDRGVLFAGTATHSILPNSIVFRWEVWTKEFLPVIDEHLVTGYGPNLPPGAIWGFTESAYITLLLRGGLPVLLLFGWILWIMARGSLAIADDRRPVARAMLVLVVAVLVMQLEENDLLDAGLGELWWALAGVLLASVSASASRTGLRDCLVGLGEGSGRSEKT